MAERIGKINRTTGDIYHDGHILVVPPRRSLAPEIILPANEGRPYRRGLETLQTVPSVVNEPTDRPLKPQKWDDSLTKNDIQGF